MKKLIAALLVALLALGSVSALAERVETYDFPVNPHRRQAMRVPMMPLPDNIQKFLSGGEELVIDEPTGDFYEKGLTWTAHVEGGQGPYQFAFNLIEPDSVFGNRSVHGAQDYSFSDTFTYRFVVPGTYRLWVWAEDDFGTTLHKNYDFTIEEDDVHPTITRIVDDLVTQCRADGATGDYETALWLHDWLTHNARYDYSYTYYSADGVLVRGIGVCDSYCKAYQLLLNAAGIDAYSIATDNHAWTVARLDGKYYHIDPTWDDPGSSEGPVSGHETHLYFGLPDAIMAFDHPFTPVEVCDSYENNYYIHTGEVSQWIDEPGGILDDGTLYIAETTLSEDIPGGLYASLLRYDVPVPDYYATGTGSFSRGKEHIVYGLCAYALSQREWHLGDRPMALDVSYDNATRNLVCSVRLDGTQLKLPGGLFAVESEAFAGDGGFMAVTLPEGMATIGERAFADCENLWSVTVPDSVTEIDDSAFENSPHVNFVCSADSAAATFASANGIHCVTPGN